MSRDDALVNEEGPREGAGNQDGSPDNPVTPKAAKDARRRPKGS